MSRRLDHLSRVFNELKDRYGEADPVVAELQSELDAREALEFRYPTNFSFSRKDHAEPGTRRPCDGLLGVSKLVKRNAPVSRFLSMN